MKIQIELPQEINKAIQIRAKLDQLNEEVMELAKKFAVKGEFCKLTPSEILERAVLKAISKAYSDVPPANLAAPQQATLPKIKIECVGFQADVAKTYTEQLTRLFADKGWLVAVISAEKIEAIFQGL